MYIRITHCFRLSHGLLAAAVLAAASPAWSQDSALLNELDQGWNSQKQTLWYATPQGSRLIPLNWLKALEQPGSQSLFLQPEHLTKFRYLPLVNSKGEKLAVGFAIDRSNDSTFERTKLQWKVGQTKTEPWVGLTCAACHTSEIAYQGKQFRVFGGPALADFQSFIKTLNGALSETASTPDKWERFASRVLIRSENNAVNRGKLKDALDQLLAWQEREAGLNKTDLRYGYGRVDAFGHIFNKVALLARASEPKQNPSDAPVSIPFIWRAPQLDRVQYNGIAPKYMPLGGSFDLGALARNTGEVIGVFGDVVTKARPGLSGFGSSVNVRSLVGLENQLMTLRPPKWPASVFGKIDEALAKVGEDLYANRCANCHAVMDRRNLKDLIKVEMSLFDGTGKFNRTGETIPAPGTDPWMACNAYDYTSQSGVLEGLPSLYFSGPPITQSHHLSGLLTVTVAGTLLGQSGAVTKEAAATWFGIPRPPIVEEQVTFLPPNKRRSPEKVDQLKRCMSNSSANLGYTSRPLNGIWATAPYLHNGSVPTLNDLLLPANQRPRKFYMGTRQYDPKNVGYLTNEDAPGNSFLFETHDSDGDEIDGNSNAGHDYSNEQLTEEMRRAIIEYLKTL